MDRITRVDAPLTYSFCLLVLAGCSSGLFRPDSTGSLLCSSIRSPCQERLRYQDRSLATAATTPRSKPGQPAWQHWPPVRQLAGINRVETIRRQETRACNVQLSSAPRHSPRLPPRSPSRIDDQGNTPRSSDGIISYLKY